MPAVTNHYCTSGALRHSGTTGWAAAYGASTATSHLTTSVSAQVDASGGGSNRLIDRGYVVIDFTSLAGAGVYNLSAFTLKLYLISGLDSVAAVPFNFALTTFSPANINSIATTDYGSFGSSNLMASLLSEPHDYVAGYKSFVADSTGLTAINSALSTSGGKLGLGIRMDYDLLNADIGAPYYAYGSFRDDSYTGTTEDPKADFTYTYTAPSSGARRRHRPSGLYVR